MSNKLKVYELTLDPSSGNSGIEFVSFVDYPAIEKNFMVFNGKQRYQFNSEQRIVTGAVMIPDLEIYRNDNSRGEFFVKFSKQTIKALNEKFMSEQKTLNFNFMHEKDSVVDSVVLVENWIVGEKDNKAKDLGFDVPPGTWMMSVKINNDKFWAEQIKTKNVQGFSIEGFFDLNLYKIKAMQMKTKNGQTFNSTAETLAVGIELTETVDGKEVPVTDGEYELENGSKIKVAESKISEIEIKEDVTVDEMETLKKVFAPIFEEMNAKIAALEVKLENQKPLPAPATPETPTKVSTIEKTRLILNKIKTK
jgi:hypothetical protein